MSDTLLDELERSAKAIAATKFGSEEQRRAIDAFHIRANAPAILSLIERLRRTENCLHEMSEELQAIGNDFGVVAGEKRTAGIRRILTEHRGAAANARRAALEEAAKVAETAADNLQDSTFEGVAAAIRDLAKEV